VPACAAGVEAYTLAIPFKEECERREIQRDIIIFASDVDQAAIAVAREGAYPLGISASISQPTLERYFRVEDEHSRVSRELRDQVVFAVHSLLREPPFSRLHLISCRNLLIYLDRELAGAGDVTVPLRLSPRCLPLGRMPAVPVHPSQVQRHASPRRHIRAAAYARRRRGTVRARYVPRRGRSDRGARDAGG
jgi:hypothetical protein